MGCDERQVREFSRGSSRYRQPLPQVSSISLISSSRRWHRGAADAGYQRDIREPVGFFRARQDHPRVSKSSAGRAPVRFGTLSIRVRDCEKNPLKRRRRARLCRDR